MHCFSFLPTATGLLLRNDQASALLSPNVVDISSERVSGIIDSHIRESECNVLSLHVRKFFLVFFVHLFVANMIHPTCLMYSA